MISLKKINANLCPPVFYSAAGLILLFLAAGIWMPDQTEAVFNAIQSWVTQNFGWFYLLSVGVFLVFIIFIAASSLGEIRLGPNEARPDFSYLSWFAMLFSAGMGIGLMFFSVGEPITHYTNAALGNSGDLSSARAAMQVTFFHWGVHAWAIYALVGLSLAYFSYRHDLPLSIRSAFYPLIGERIHGPIGHAVDVFAILGTMFGIATSLGLGALQVNTGLNYLFDIPVSSLSQTILIALITLAATVSVVIGLDKGIKNLSNFNLILALALLLFVLVASDTLFLFNVWIENLGVYFGSLIDVTFHMHAYSGEEAQVWLGSWTLFYWAWWIAWSPFVGMFIARISRGRTIREFALGVLLVPAGFTTLWLTVFGNSAMALDLGRAAGGITEAVGTSFDFALFQFLQYFPYGDIVSMLAVVLIITFFVTSSDSGSLVIDMIASGNKENPPAWQRVFWAMSEGLVAIALLLTGGLKALQTASIAAALPFAVIMLFMCYGLYRGLRLEKQKQTAHAIPTVTPVTGGATSWEKKLRTIVTRPTHQKVRTYMQETLMPALEKVAAEMAARGLSVALDHDEESSRLDVGTGDEHAFSYAVHIIDYNKPAFTFGWRRTDPEKNDKYCHAEVYLNDGGQHYDIYGFTEEQVINDILTQYERHLYFLHTAN